MEYYKNLDLADIKYFCEIDQVWKTEEWKPLKNFHGVYMVSDIGRLKSLRRPIEIKNNKFRILRERIKRQQIDNNGYLIISLSLKSKTISKQVHQLVAVAFLGHIPCGHELVVNHKNFNRLDNRRLNLEITTNRKNTNKAHISSISKYVGVSWNKNRNKWMARIRIGKNHKYLGLFEKEEDAASAYNDKLNEIS